MTTTPDDALWSLTLFVSGAAARSTQAVATVRAVCDEERGGRVDLTVVDAAEHPGQAHEHDVVALPTLVRCAPGPLRHLVGNLTDPDQVRAWLAEVLTAPPATADATTERGDAP